MNKLLDPLERQENPQNLVIPDLNFISTIKYISLSLLAAVLAQNLFLWFGPGGWTGSLAGSVVFMAFSIVWGRSLFRIVGTPYFAVSGLLSIAIATALGTFVSQNMLPDLFVNRYGEGTSKILTFFHLNDLFHSWWYVVLFILLSISLIKISSNRKINRANLGFHLSHLAPVIILFGFWWDYYAGFRGLVQLLKGKSTSTVRMYQRNTNVIIDTLKLDFKLRLDNFVSQNHAPDHRIQIWRSNQVVIGEGAANDQYELVASLPLDLNREHRIYDSDIRFQLKEYYPNFYLNYSYPELLDTIPPRSPGMILEVQTPHGSNMLQLQALVPGKNIMDEPLLGTTFEYYWELPANIRSEVTRFDPTSEWAKRNRIVFDGKNSVIYEHYQGILSEKILKLNEYFQIPGKTKSGYTVIIQYPDVNYLISEPTSRDKEQLNPVARLIINNDTWSQSREAFLFPAAKGRGGQFKIPDSPYRLALESQKDKETKYWESELSIVDENNQVLASRSIKVNEPLNFMGYRFYQTDYDPNNPNYSGIGVSYSPGLHLIYFGFYLLAAGVFIMFYLRRKQSQIEENRTGDILS